MPSPLTTEERRTVSDFQEKLESFYSDFGTGKTMVLSTSADGIVSSRMMSVVLIDGKFFFQTDKELRKYSQLKNNKNVALCIDNIQILKTLILPRVNTALKNIRVFKIVDGRSAKFRTVTLDRWGLNC